MPVSTNGKPYAEYLDAQVRGEVYRSHVISKLNPGPLNPDNANLIKAHIRDRQVIGGNVSDKTAKSIASYLVMFSRKTGPFKEMNEDTFIETIQHFRKTLSPTTTRRMIPVIKTFMKWLKVKSCIPDITDASITSIKPPKKKDDDVKGRKAGDMITADELKALINGAPLIRDKAIIALMFESGMRPTEIASLRWSNMLLDEHGIQLNVSGKTGKPRYIRLIWSKSYIVAWMNEYPDPIAPTSPVFVGQYRDADTGHHRPITQSLLKYIVYESKKNAGIEKRLFPYLLRHSRVTQMVADEIPVPVILEQLWGSQDTRMIQTYLHLKNSDIDRIMLSRHGVENQKRAEPVKEPICPKCGTKNLFAAKYCCECMGPLTEEARKRNEQLAQAPAGIPLEKLARLAKLMDSPEFAKFEAQMMQEEKK